MSDAREHDTDALGEGELLAAYLDGQTDDVTTTRLERRLALDPDLAARLDALAATRAQLQRLAQVEMPDDARQRLRARLIREREEQTPAAVVRRRRPRWTPRLAPLAAAAAVVLVVVVGLASVIPGTVEQGAEESADGSADSVEQAAGAADAEPPAVSDPAAQNDAAANGAAEAEPPAEATQGRVIKPPAAVDGDAEIAARAERLLQDPPVSLGARERRLRRRAGLPSDVTCVADLEASTVDLIAEDGRVALAVLLDEEAGQIVLLDPTTCAPIRMISTNR